MVSSFLRKGKKVSWTGLIGCFAVTGLFTTLSLQPEHVDPESMTELEKFIIVMYSNTCTLSRVDEVKKQLLNEGVCHYREHSTNQHCSLSRHQKSRVCVVTSSCASSISAQS